MKKKLYEVYEILESGFSRGQIMTEHNVKMLGLGVIQSKRYFEALAVLRSSRNTHDVTPGTGVEAKMLNLIASYHAKK